MTNPTDDLAIAYAAGSRQAGQALIRATEGLCYSAALPVSRAAGVDLEDLLQACRVGVLKAVATYEPGRSAFTTHAFWTMRAEMRDCVIDERTVRVPSWVDDAAIKARRKGEHVEQIAECVSLDDGDRKYALSNQPSPDASPEDQYQAAEQRAWVLEQCSEQERDVLTWRMDGSTLQEIGEAIGRSRERIRQIESGAVRRIAERLGMQQRRTARRTKEKQAA